MSARVARTHEKFGPAVAVPPWSEIQVRKVTCSWPGSPQASTSRSSLAGAGELEGYPNRDSLPYQEMYGLEDVKTMFRGTLRNLGHCESWYHWVKLGLFDTAPRLDLAGLGEDHGPDGQVGVQRGQVARGARRQLPSGEPPASLS